MQVEQKLIVNLMRSDARFEIPLFQRVYSWTERQCEELWADVLRIGATQEDHFMGTVLYDDGEGSKGDPVIHELIDGQQRFTTVALMVVAIRDRAKELDLKNEELQPEHIDRELLFVKTPTGVKTKLKLSDRDQPSFEALLLGSNLPEGDELSKFIIDNYTFFKKRMKDVFVVETVWVGLQQLLVIAVKLEDGDQPQTVFESLNSKGLALSSSDLIRNLLFVHFGYEDQKRLYDLYWEPLEDMFEKDPDVENLYIDAALHAWLEVNAPEIELQERSEIYSAFKTYVRNHPHESLEFLLKSLNEFCKKFSEELDTEGAKKHIDWVKGKRDGLVSERKLFGD